MNDKADAIVLILRFILGAILGALLSFVLMISLSWLSIKFPFKSVFLPIGATITLIAAISATIWGDKFLLGLMKLFRFFRYFC